MSGKRELWQMATRWLQNLGVLPEDSPALLPTARVYDLALALQDGTVLCNALNRLKANTVKLVHQKPEKQFLKMQNINSFLGALQSQFGLKQNDVFTADQLYYASDFARVVNTISLLSRTSIAKGSEFRPFPEDDSVSAMADTADDDGEDMYQSLEDLVGQSLSLEEARGDAMDFFDDDDDADDDQIYGSIQNVVEEGGDEVYTDLLYSEGESIYGTGATTPDEKRNCVLAELVDTERNYVKVLQTIVDVFQKTLGSQRKVISPVDCSIIFSNVGDLLVAHKEFLADMEQAMQAKTGRIISQCFMNAMKPFRCYGQFCCEIPDAIQKLKELSAKPASAKVLDSARKASGQRFPLKDLLNVPMQRILKYPLLLKELLKHTPAGHPDKEQLPISLNAVQELAKFINETKKDHDNLKNMVASLKQYQGKPLQEYGSLVKDGDLMYKMVNQKDKLKLRYMFLFSSAIVNCKPKGVFFNFKSTIELDADYEIVDIPFWTLPKDEQNGKYTYAWALKGHKGSQDISHIFAAKTLPSKKKWVTSIQMNLDAIKDRKAGPPPAPARGTGADADAPAPPSRPPTTPAQRPQPAAPVESPAKDKKKPKGSYEQWVVGGSAPTPEPVKRQDSRVSTDDSWFAGKMPRAKAERLLTDSADGTFLVRESDSRPGDYSLSVKYKVVKHIKINRHGNKYDLAPDAKAFPSIQELVEHFQQHSLNRHFPGMETNLHIPFKHAMSRATLPRGGVQAKDKVMGIGRARSRFAYTAKSDDELTFERGVEIVILSTHDQDPGWWKGALPNGQIGVFPASYVQQL